MSDTTGSGLLANWLKSRNSAERPDTPTTDNDLRFAFYGRTSTTEYQDPATSKSWQLEAARSLVAGCGVIVAEFFGIGCSRREPWPDRPQAAALLAAMARPDRGFDAIVVGEYDHAFAAGQFDEMAAMFERHGVQVWLPEANGPVEVGSVMHQALMAVLGAQSQREVLRARHRVRAAMGRQVVEQGRYLGGRPPYGYRLVDVGPHPNRAHARWGRRARRLEADPATALHVRWIFAQRLAGRSAASIARDLTERGIACPSGADPSRNRHRAGEEWSLRAVIEILGNPRYTGREVWNRTSVDRSRRQADTGRFARTRTEPARWVVSAAAAHPALVSEEDFVATQAVRAVRTAADGRVRAYRLAGLVWCGVCERRMEAHRVHGRAGYRCRHGYRSSRIRPSDASRNVYAREDHLIDRVRQGLEANGDYIGPAPDDVLAVLRSSGGAIICTATAMTLTLRQSLSDKADAKVNIRFGYDPKRMLLP